MRLRTHDSPVTHAFLTQGVSQSGDGPVQVSTRFPRHKVLRMINWREFRLYRHLVAEGERIVLLRIRFGPDLPDDLVARLNRLYEPRQLEPLADLAAICSRLEEFHAALPPLPSPRRRSPTARP